MAGFSSQASSYTGRDAATEVRRIVGDESGVMLTDNDLIAWINGAQRDISDHLDLHGRAMVDVIKGQALYVLDPDLLQSVKALKLIQHNGVTLRPVEFQEAQEKFYGKGVKERNPGIPEYWWRYAGEITLVPTPDETIQDGLVVYFAREPVKIGSLADPLDIPDSHFNALVNSVLTRAYTMTEEIGLANMAKGEMMDSIMTQRNRERLQQTNSYPSIRITEGY